MDPNSKEMTSFIYGCQWTKMRNIRHFLAWPESQTNVWVREQWSSPFVRGLVLCFISKASRPGVTPFRPTNKLFHCLDFCLNSSIQSGLEPYFIMRTHQYLKIETHELWWALFKDLGPRLRWLELVNSTRKLSQLKTRPSYRTWCMYNQFGGPRDPDPLPQQYARKRTEGTPWNWHNPLQMMSELLHISHLMNKRSTRVHMVPIDWANI